MMVCQNLSLTVYVQHIRWLAWRVLLKTGGETAEFLWVWGFGRHSTRSRPQELKRSGSYGLVWGHNICMIITDYFGPQTANGAGGRIEVNPSDYQADAIKTTTVSNHNELSITAGTTLHSYVPSWKVDLFTFAVSPTSPAYFLFHQTNGANGHVVPNARKDAPLTPVLHCVRTPSIAGLVLLTFNCFFV